MNQKDYTKEFNRGLPIYLGIRRQRWRNNIDKLIAIKSDYSFKTEGSKLTVELSDFLKGTGPRPDKIQL